MSRGEGRKMDHHGLVTGRSNQREELGKIRSCWGRDSMKSFSYKSVTILGTGSEKQMPFDLHVHQLLKLQYLKYFDGESLPVST